MEGGDSFSEALQKHPKAFSRLYVCMVAAGEKGGLLAEILARLATYLENTARLRKKVKSAMMYPDRRDRRGDPDHDLPAGQGGAGLRRDLYRLRRQAAGADAVSDQDQRLREELLHPDRCSAAAGRCTAGSISSRPRPAASFWDSRRIKLPIFGAIAHKICLARFTRTLASLIRSGVPILEVLQIVSQTVGNVVMEKAIKTAACDIERGESISAALAKHPVFPTMIIRMVTAGEQTGKIDNMLERISDFLDEEIETTLSGLTSLIEPILIVFLGVVVGGMVICMFLPIFKLPEIVSKQLRRRRLEKDWTTGHALEARGLFHS